jgi:hypothetical protein
MADEMKQLEGATKALSKKEKRLMKKQLQKQSAKKKEESDESEEDNEDDDQMEEDAQVEKEDEEDDDEEAMYEDEELIDEESKEGEGDPLKDIKAFKKIVVTALIDNKMDQKRASKMEILDFLNLLKIFNEKGIHFK